MRTAFRAIAILMLIPASAPAARNEKFQLDGHAYDLHAPAKEGRVVSTNAFLFVWLHSGGIGAKVQFDWWVASKMFDQDMILLCPQAAAVSNGWNVATDKAFLDKLVAQVAGEYKVAADRTILGGHSLGGSIVSPGTSKPAAHRRFKTRHSGWAIVHMSRHLHPP